MHDSKSKIKLKFEKGGSFVIGMGACNPTSISLSLSSVNPN